MASMANVGACDRQSQAVFEISTKTVAVRKPVDGIVAVTNHFRDKSLAVDLECRRFTALEKSREMKQLSVTDVHHHLHAANQGAWTIQTMVFEPASLKLHLSIGAGPTSARPLTTIDLAPLMGAK
jgi:isopenicillin-N N-acyltransferase like protein